MSQYSVWLDHQYAYIYKFTNEGVDEMTLKADAHHSGDNKHRADEKFYHAIASKLTDADELVLLGPGTAKEQFKHHCEKHHHKKLAKAVIGTKAMEGHPTKAMMMQEARNIFKHHHMWTKNY